MSVLALTTQVLVVAAVLMALLIGFLARRCQCAVLRAMPVSLGVPQGFLVGGLIGMLPAWLTFRRSIAEGLSPAEADAVSCPRSCDNRGFRRIPAAPISTEGRLLMQTTEHFIAGKDASLESTISTMQQKLAALGFAVEERSWLHPVENIWSVHLRDSDCPLLYTNGKGASELAARASALGEFFERVSNNYFWSHYYLGETIAQGPVVHFPSEKWFAPGKRGSWPKDILTLQLQEFYNPEGAVNGSMLVDLNSGNAERGICAIPYTRLRDGATVYFPVNIIGNLYVSNGMAAGNTPAEARAQALSEVVERYVKFRVIRDGLCLPDVPEEVIARYPQIAADIATLD